ncbi:MAG: AAA family ATPase [Candidatus Taylorbacteria bacterium]|nr:AAA family ATPase [Candidatus Taylorbacteria bacterium]
MKNKHERLKEYIDSLEGAGEEVSLDPQEEKTPQPFSWKEINSMIFPEDRWRVENLLPIEGISILASASGEGKTIMMMDLIKSITNGTPWLGQFKIKKAKLLYVNLEMSVSEIQRRGRKIGFDVDDNNLIILNEDDFNLNEGIGQEDMKYKWLLKFIYDKKIEVVIIDTFRAASGGLKEEKAEEIRKFFQKFQILKNSGVSVVFLEHVRKPTQIEGKIPKKEQLLGSQDKTANAEVLLMIRKDDVTGNINVYQRKNRIGIEVPPFAIRMVDIVKDDGTERIEFQYVGEIDDDTNKKEEAKDLVMQILSTGEIKTRKELGELTKKQVGDRNLRVGLKELVHMNMIDYFKDGKCHCYFIPKEKKEEETEEESLLNQKNVDFFDI